MKTQVITIHPRYPELDKIAQCAKIIRQGGLVVFPTETVYGVAADYSNPQAIARLREIKKRSAEKPFSIPWFWKRLFGLAKPAESRSQMRSLQVGDRKSVV